MKSKNKKRKSNYNWFEPSARKLNWSKDETQARRRRNALKARRNNALKAARALQALANVTSDEDTHRKARADALYFFRMHNKRRK